MVAQTVTAETNGVDAKAKLNGKAIKSKNQLRRLKAKEKKATQTSKPATVSVKSSCNLMTVLTSLQNGDTDVEMNIKEEPDEQPAEYVPEPLDLNAPSLAGFADVFARFQLPPEESKVRVVTYRRLYPLTQQSR